MASPRPDGSVAATWYVLVGGNDVWWRCEAPAEQVGGRVAKIPEALFDEVGFPNTHTALPWRMLVHRPDRMSVIETKRGWKRMVKDRVQVVSVMPQFPEHEGVAVFARPGPARAILARHMRDQGVRTIAETDDNHFADRKHNLFMRQQRHDEKTMLDHAKAMAGMGVNVFSTGWLRDHYHARYRDLFGKKGLPEMHVCRNHVPRAMWPERIERDGPLRVGFMGSPSHVWDVNLAYSAFHAAKVHGCHTTMIGYSPGNPDPDNPESVTLEDGSVVWARDERSREVSGKWSRVIDEEIRWILPGEYHRAALPLDIGVAPLFHNSFTQGKSDIKAIEYTISGAAVVCANLPLYSTAGWKHGVNCLMASSPDDYGIQTIRLIRDEKLRAELVQAAQEMVREERNEDVMRAEWSVALGL